jgi:hypothetical protein
MPTVRSKNVVSFVLPEVLIHSVSFLEIESVSTYLLSFVIEMVFDPITISLCVVGSAFPALINYMSEEALCICIFYLMGEVLVFEVNEVGVEKAMGDDIAI